MVISDRISAFDCIWQGVDGLNGVPGKGAALNAISSHWFKLFKEQGLADSHILDIPTPSSGSCKSPSRDDRGHCPPVHHRLHVACLQGW
jgi:phosphoribosylaminoimidazole-succinocarboxamide synthase